MEREKDRGRRTKEKWEREKDRGKGTKEKKGERNVKTEDKYEKGERVTHSEIRYILSYLQEKEIERDKFTELRGEMRRDRENENTPLSDKMQVSERERESEGRESAKSKKNHHHMRALLDNYSNQRVSPSLLLH